MGENFNQATQALPPLENGLVCEVLNEPHNSQGCNQCGIITHTQGGEAVLKLNGFHRNRNMPLLVRNAIRKGKTSEREPMHGDQTP
jgi:hypothetical protein